MHRLVVGTRHADISRITHPNEALELIARVDERCSHARVEAAKGRSTSKMYGRRSSVVEHYEVGS